MERGGSVFIDDVLSREPFSVTRPIRQQGYLSPSVEIRLTGGNKER
jgi:hypothetical protein